MQERLLEKILRWNLPLPSLTPLPLLLSFFRFSQAAAENFSHRLLESAGLKSFWAAARAMVTTCDVDRNPKNNL
jgi:hypothetical protein